MRIFTKTLITAAVLAATPMLAQAESDFDFGSSPTASADLDFQIVIPQFLLLRVGSLGSTVDLIEFNVAAADVGNGTAVSGTGGDLSNGTVTASVIGNGGNVTLTSTTTGPLTNAAGDTISYAEISTAVAALNSATPLPHPTLNDATPGSVTLTAANGVVVQDAQWTYTYDNSNVVAAGTYGGVNTNNGRVTYTATSP